MSISIVVHIVNEEPILAEIDKMPNPEDQTVIVSNPRRRDGNDLPYIEEEVTTVIIPWHRVNFIEIISSAEREEIITFVREE